MSKNLTENSWGGVFPDEETFQKIYCECLEKAPQAPEAVTNSYSAMSEIFEEYLSAVEEYTFRHAYQCGYEAAIAEMKKGGAA